LPSLKGYIHYKSSVNRLMQRFLYLTLKIILIGLTRALRGMFSLSKKPHSSFRKISLTMVSTWNVRCGIADYTRFLTSHLKKEIMKVTILPIKSPPSTNPFYYASLAIKASMNADIIHVQYEPGLFGRIKFLRFSFPLSYIFFLFLLLFGAKKRIVFTLHAVTKEWRKSSGGRIGRIINKSLMKFIGFLCDVVIVHTKASKCILKGIINDKKIKIIPHGAYENPKRLNKQTCKRVLGLSNKKVITIFGFVTKNKGHDLLIDLMPKFNDDVRLVVAGGARTESDTRYLSFLKKKVKKFGVQRKVVFLDYIPEEKIPVVLSATDVAVLPYRNITESGAVHIILSHSVPTVTADLPNFREIKEEFNCVVLFKKDDKDDLFKKVTNLLNDEKERHRLSESCKKFWESRRWKVIAKMHKILYLDMVSDHPDSIYRESEQAERVQWLVKNAQGNTLEIGCATGFISSAIGHAVGIDISRVRIVLAKEKHPNLDFILADGKNLPFRRNAFDTVILPDVLEHMSLASAKKVVEESEFVASNLLLATLPNAEKPNYHKSLVENPEHKWFPTKNKVKALFGYGALIQYTTQKNFILLRKRLK